MNCNESKCNGKMREREKSFKQLLKWNEAEMEKKLKGNTEMGKSNYNFSFPIFVFNFEWKMK